MAIKMVRQPSDTPNINNIDDIIGLRYAYGNQDGYVKDKGNELGYSVDGSNFKVLSGRVVLQGVESDVDANGVTLTVDNVSELRYYTVYYQVNMATNITSILLSNYDTATYPVIDKGDDLTANTIGIANLELYHFQAQNGIISKVEKIVEKIEYINTKSTVNNSNKIQNVDFSDETKKSYFGDCLIERYKTIWEGKHNLIQDGELNINLNSIYFGHKIEISFGELKAQKVITFILPNNFSGYYDVYKNLARIITNYGQSSGAFVGRLEEQIIGCFKTSDGIGFRGTDVLYSDITSSAPGYAIHIINSTNLYITRVRVIL